MALYNRSDHDIGIISLEYDNETFVLLWEIGQVETTRLLLEVHSWLEQGIDRDDCAGALSKILQIERGEFDDELGSGGFDRW